jgi:hypothetical protein
MQTTPILAAPETAPPRTGTRRNDGGAYSSALRRAASYDPLPIFANPAKNCEVKGGSYRMRSKPADLHAILRHCSPRGRSPFTPSASRVSVHRLAWKGVRTRHSR